MIKTTKTIDEILADLPVWDGRSDVDEPDYEAIAEARAVRRCRWQDEL